MNTPTPTPAAELSDAAIAQAFRELDTAVNAHLFFADNRDLRMTTGDHAMRAKKLLDAIEVLRPAIEATRELPAASLGEWVLVPKEPTESMFQAARRVDSKYGEPSLSYSGYSEIYAAMLAATQPAPAPSSAGEGEVYRCDFCGSDYTDSNICCERRRQYLSAHSERAPKPEAGAVGDGDAVLGEYTRILIEEYNDDPPREARIEAMNRALARSEGVA